MSDKQSLPPVKLPRVFWLVTAVLLTLSLVGWFFVKHHDTFPGQNVFGFDAAYGFLTCVAMIAGAKLLGKVIQRPDDYYDAGGEDA
ncbi:MAG: hypothetical protein AAF533_13750 [Acidobacteriota bacterium]